MQLSIIKIGGNIIDDEAKLAGFLDSFAATPGKKILVHGGGKLATRVAEALGIKQQLVDGRRITDAETLKVVTMVYAGTVNKNIVANLQARGCDAIGLTGADGNSILAHKRTHPAIDYGWVGDVDSVDAAFLTGLLTLDKTLVFAPITHDGQGHLLNTNADTIAQELARGLGRSFDVSLVYSFEKSGVLMDADDDNSVLSRIGPAEYQDLKAKQVIFAGMIPKLDNAFAALRSGVRRVIIGRAEELPLLLAGKAGTTIVNE
ncbi:MAG TPA: acetylglutamate kinase [Puia sp.]|jgi:acetylglutamate kinase|nr:acetylglutamate kinase [Puia sp.]